MAVNSNPQAVRVSNEKFRPLCDKLGGLYNYAKALQAEAVAEGWVAMFPNNADTIGDGADVDGRAVITNADNAALITLVGNFITFMEQNTFANRNLVLKIAVNPQNY